MCNSLFFENFEAQVLRISDILRQYFSQALGEPSQNVAAYFLRHLACEYDTAHPMIQYLLTHTVMRDELTPEVKEGLLEIFRRYRVFP